MRSFTLTRIASDARETRGVLTDEENREICKTLELGWHDNAHNVSCVPAQGYTATRRWSPEHNEDLFGLVNVPGRGDIEMHPGNYYHDSKGCILLGTTFADIDHDGEIDITSSQDAFKRFMAMMAGERSFTLTIIAAPGEAQAAA